MGKSEGRDAYFEKHCRYAPDVKTYLESLSKSPYRKHRRMAVLLLPELKRMIQEQKDLVEKIKKDKEQYENDNSGE